MALKGLLVSSTVALLLGCSTTASIDRERQGLLQTDREWAAAAGEGKDLEKIVSFWSDDATLIPPGAPVVKGKDAIRDYVRQSLAIPGFRITWHSDEAILSGDGTMAVTIGENTITVPGADGKMMTLKGRGTAVWRRDGNGQWKCVVDIWNSGP